jgi:hypothetical protein
MTRIYISRELRERVAVQARHRCGYCLTAESVVGTPMELEHLLPQALGGLTEESNLWLACSLCNDYKNNRIAEIDPLTGEEVRLFNPRHQEWNQHFEWSANGEQILGKTPIGRATVAMLQLNRPSLLTARLPGCPLAGIRPRTDAHRELLA